MFSGDAFYKCLYDRLITAEEKQLLLLLLSEFLLVSLVYTHVATAAATFPLQRFTVDNLLYNLFQILSKSSV